MRLDFATRFGLLLFFIVSICSVSKGQSDHGNTNNLQAITITARGYETPLSKTPGSIAVIDRHMLRNDFQASISDFAFHFPGVNSMSDAAWGSEFSVRGLDRESVIMMIDGCRVNTSTALGARFGMVAVRDIDRVEILKGPSSSLYGSGSLGGVVNVLTRRPEFSRQPRSSKEIFAGAGSNPGGIEGYANWEFSDKSHYIFLSQGYRDYGSYEDGSGEKVENSQYADAQSSIKAGYKLDPVYRIEANLQYFQGWEIGIPGSGTAPLPQRADVTYPSADRLLASLVFSAEPSGQRIKASTLNAYYQHIKRRVRIDGFPDKSPVEEVNPGADHDTFGVRWFNRMVYAGHTVAGGVDVWRRTYEGSRTKRLRSGALKKDKPLPDAVYDSAGLFAEDNVSVGRRLSLNFGARVDWIGVDNESTEQIEEDIEKDTSWNGHLGAAFSMTDNLSMKALAARSYRAASLDERFQFLELGGGVVKLGNPELDPEVSTFVESGLEWSGSDAFFSLTVFGNYLDDLISERMDSPGVIKNANVNEARIAGAEFSTTVVIAPGLETSGNLSFIEGRDTVRDEYLPGIPPVNGHVSVKKSIQQRGWIELQSEFAGEQDKTPEGVADTDDWMALNLAAGWRWSSDARDCRLFFGVDNLFDADYRNYMATYRGNLYQEPGRSFNIGYEAVF